MFLILALIYVNTCIKFDNLTATKLHGDERFTSVYMWSVQRNTVLMYVAYQGVVGIGTKQSMADNAFY